MMFDEEPGRDAHEQCRFEIDQLRTRNAELEKALSEMTYLRDMARERIDRDKERNEALEAKLAVMKEDKRKADEHFKDSVEMYMGEINRVEAKLAAENRKVAELKTQLSFLRESHSKLKLKLAALVDAAEVFRKEAVVLSADYLKAFESYRDDDCYRIK